MIKMLISWKMHNKSYVNQKNVIPILLPYSCVVLSVKNILHACYVEKYGQVIYVYLFAISCKIARAKNMNNTCS
jgi:hypothetical protein